VRRLQSGPWLSTAHHEQHKPGGGDEITPAAIGAATAEHEHAPASAADAAGFEAQMSALQAQVSALQSAFDAHKAAKAGVAHKA
jgi:hypothetical protein